MDYSRGYYGRGRGRGRGSGNSYRGGFTLAPRTPERSITEGLSARAVDTLDVRSLRFAGGLARAGLLTPAATVARTNNDVSLKDFRCIGSYSWIESPNPTILVPGSPRLWDGMATPFSIKTDGETFGSEQMFADQNAHRVPSSPLLPLIAAVDHLNADEPFEWGSADFVTDRNGLRKLIRWIERSESLTDFRIDVQLAGERTVLFSRWEPRTLGQSFPQAYGFSFEKTQTKPAKGCEQATGHHRIVTYDFDGLQMVVRFEVDACLPPKWTSTTSPVSRRITSASTDVDDLTALLSGTRISDEPTTALVKTSQSSSTAIFKTTSGPTLTIRSVGTLVPQKDIIELTTRSSRNAANFSWPEAFPQLWLSQTGYHFLAIHERGTFTSVTRRAIDGSELRDVAENSQESFKKLRRVLGAIQDLLIEHGRDARLSLVCRNGVLEVFKREDGSSVLPQDVLKRFMV